MTNIDAIVNDIFNQMKLYSNLGKKAVINVYVARQNLKPVVHTLLARANRLDDTEFENLSEFTTYVDRVYGHDLNVWQKPDPHQAPINHLLLTVGGLTAIIFDYEESV